MSQFINYHSLSGKASIDRTNEAKPSSEHRCLVLAQLQANGDSYAFTCNPIRTNMKTYFRKGKELLRISNPKSKKRKKE